MARPVSMLGVYRKFPRELFKLNKGPQIRLREYKLPRGPSFDVVANHEGNIEPRALDLATYAGKCVIAYSLLILFTPKYMGPAPNGASMRPNTTSMQSITERFHSPQAVVFSVAPGRSRPFPAGMSP